MKDMRIMLDDMAEALGSAGWRAANVIDASDLQRMACSAESASDALFDLMNAAKVHLRDEQAGDVMAAWLQR